MCGLTGFYTPGADKKRSDLHAIAMRMNDTLAHRGPDSHDIWQDPDVALVLAHRRLAILDLTPEGHQPMASESGRYMLAYNGEIYNYLALQKELEANGVKFRGRSDTEVILAAVENWGLNRSLQKINGMFALALWDRQEKTLHLLRDRMGKKPLYVGWAGKALVFASELKAFHAYPDFKADLNRDTLASFMRYACMPAPHSIYKNVWQIPAGHRLSLNTQSLKPDETLPALMEPFWDHSRALEEAKSKTPAASESAMIDEFEELLSACVQDRMISDVPLGAFLSGGIDSSSVVALMQKTASRKVKTYSIGFEETGFNEAPHARKIADHLGTDHHELYLNPKDAMDVIPLLPEMYDEPFADISAIPTYLVSKFARNDVTVALSGDGGDEMLGGYNRHIEGPKIWNRMRMLPLPLRKTLAEMIGHVSPARWDGLMKNHPQFGTRIHKAASILTCTTQEDMYNRLLSHWDTPPVIQAAEVKTVLQDDKQPQNLEFAEKMMYWDALLYLPGDILTKVDRASMAVSLEARAPLLDRRIYDYAWSLPVNMKIRNGQGKYILRKVLERHVPRALFERPKQGFAMPVGSWLRGSLKDWTENLLDEKKLKSDGILNSAPVRTAWEDHLAGNGNHDTKLWSVLMFQAWKERWM